MRVASPPQVGVLHHRLRGVLGPTAHRKRSLAEERSPSRHLACDLDARAPPETDKRGGSFRNRRWGLFAEARRNQSSRGGILQKAFDALLHTPEWAWNPTSDAPSRKQLAIRRFMVGYATCYRQKLRSPNAKFPPNRTSVPGFSVSSSRLPRYSPSVSQAGRSRSCSGAKVLTRDEAAVLSRFSLFRTRSIFSGAPSPTSSCGAAPGSSLRLLQAQSRWLLRSTSRASALPNPSRSCFWPLASSISLSQLVEACWANSRAKSIAGAPAAFIKVA